MERNPNQRKARERERERERELEMFSMMRFNSATSSFLAMFVIEPYGKLKVKNSKTFSRFAAKIQLKPFLLCCRWPVMIVKHRKGQKYS